MRLLFVGFGTVAQGLAELLLEKREILKTRYGFSPTVVGIADTLKGNVYHDEGLDLAKALSMVKKGESLDHYPDGEKGMDAVTLIRHAKADCLVEATYTDLKTGEPATTHIKEAFYQGMDVVTTNKGPVALHYKALKALAAKEGCKFYFEGTVMSGTPLINLLRETLKGNRIFKIKGILNGTTNYILTRMEEGLAYEEALKEAQEKGYAEAVPDADVKGWDALAKATILANVVFEKEVKPEDIPCQGIEAITLKDVQEAKKEGSCYKLIVALEEGKEGFQAEVSPKKLPFTHPLAGIKGATNGVTITTDCLGDVTILGPGAGRRETGYSILIDLLHIGGGK